MTHAASSSRPEPRLWRLCRQAAHHGGVHVWLGVLAVDLLSPLMPSVVRGGVAGISALALGLVVVAGWRHDRHLCTWCARSTPLDPQVEVERHGRALQALHGALGDFGKGRSTVVVAVAVVCVALMLASSWLVPDRRYSNLLSVPLDALMVAWTYVLLTHQRLRPWCPWCRRRRDWDEEGFPEPSPDPEGAPTPERAS